VKNINAYSDMNCETALKFKIKAKTDSNNKPIKILSVNLYDNDNFFTRNSHRKNIRISTALGMNGKTLAKISSNLPIMIFIKSIIN